MVIFRGVKEGGVKREEVGGGRGVGRGVGGGREVGGGIGGGREVGGGVGGGREVGGEGLTSYHGHLSHCFGVG